MTAFAAVTRQIPPVHLDRAALGAESPDLGLGLVVGEKAGLAGAATAVVFRGFHTKTGVDREAQRDYNSRQQMNRPAGVKSSHPAPAPGNNKENSL